MSEDAQELDNSQGGTGADAPISNNDGAPDGGQSELDKMRAALKKANAEAKAYREAKQKSDAELETVRTKQKLENEEYLTLYQESEAKRLDLETKAAKAERLEAAMVASNELRIANVPDQFKPGLEILSKQLSPEAFAEYLDVEAENFKRKPIPNMNSGAGGAGGIADKPDVTDADRTAAAIAQQNGYNITAEGIAARRKTNE